MSISGTSHYYFLSLALHEVKCPLWNRILLEKLTGSQLVKKFFEFFWNPEVQNCIHTCPPPVPILSQTNPVHASTSTSWRSILIYVTSHIRLGVPCSLFRFPYQNTVCTSPVSHTGQTQYLIQTYCYMHIRYVSIYYVF